MSRRNGTGVALLEAIVALMIVSVAGVSAATLVAQSMAAVRQARDADEESRVASTFLEVVALWPREELDRRLGSRRQGEWTLRVERPEATLYALTLADSTGRRVLLRTALFRAEAANARP